MSHIYWSRNFAGYIIFTIIHWIRCNHCNFVLFSQIYYSFRFTVGFTNHPAILRVFWFTSLYIIIAKWKKSALAFTESLHSSNAPMQLKLGTGLEPRFRQCTKQFAVVTLKTRASTTSGSASGELDTLWNIGQNFRSDFFLLRANGCE